MLAAMVSRAVLAVRWAAEMAEAAALVLAAAVALVAFWEVTTLLAAAQSAMGRPKSGQSHKNGT